MDTRRGASHIGACHGWGAKGGIAGGEGWGGIVLGKIPNVDDGVMDAANRHGMCIPM